MLYDNMNTIELTCYTEIEHATNSPTTFAQYVYKLVPFPQLVDRQVGHARVDIKIKVHKDEITLIFFSNNNNNENNSSMGIRQIFGYKIMPKVN